MEPATIYVRLSCLLEDDDRIEDDAPFNPEREDDPTEQEN